MRHLNVFNGFIFPYRIMAQAEGYPVVIIPSKKTVPRLSQEDVAMIHMMYCEEFDIRGREAEVCSVFLIDVWKEARRRWNLN